MGALGMRCPIDGQWMTSMGDQYGGLWCFNGHAWLREVDYNGANERYTRRAWMDKPASELAEYRGTMGPLTVMERLGY